ncbi:MAG TPA: peptidoglycan DD-metalloendopeptidase family protein [Dehalococcoidia bacterium]
METLPVQPPSPAGSPRRAVPNTLFGAVSAAQSFQALLSALNADAEGRGSQDLSLGTLLGLVGGGRLSAGETGLSRLDPLVRAALYASVLGDRMGLGEPGGLAGLRGLPGAGAAAQPDPYGWRALARAIGEQVIGPGFGRVFEAQIDQESGFDPAVVFGQRRSPAGAEGIAQLMPQFYPHVNRLDPYESLQAAAQTMRRNLQTFGGDVEKALAAYNAGVGRVTEAVRTYGAGWKLGLPEETRVYLDRIFQRLSAPAPAAGGLVWPARGALTTDFGAVDDLHSTPHTGIDIAAPMGSPIVAAADGTVSHVERCEHGYGWHVIVDHGNGLQTLYGHLSRIDVVPGQQVRAGQVIAGMGSTGYSTGPHLHFEVRRNGVPVNPFDVLP